MNKTIAFNWGEMIRWLFTMMKHKINNTGWIWDDDEQRGGTKQNQKGMPNVFSIYIFLIRDEVKGLEFALAKLRGLCKYLANVCNLHSHVYGLHYSTCAQEQGRKINAMRRVVLWKSSALSQHKIWRSLLPIEFTTLPPKPQPLLWTKWKGKQEE